jgi:hypothetical protein
MTCKTIDNKRIFLDLVSQKYLISTISGLDYIEFNYATFGSKSTVEINLRKSNKDLKFKFKTFKEFCDNMRKLNLA